MKYRGFTLLELVLVIAIMGTLATAIAPGFFSSLKNYNLLSVRSQALGQARSALDRMVKEIRLVPSTDEITGIAANNFQFQYPAGTAISYSLSGSNILRNSDQIIKNATALAFSYYDEDGAVTATIANVRSVGILLTVDPPGDIPDLSLRTRIFLRNTGNAYGYGYDMN